MRRRIFIAINLPELVRKELAYIQTKWPELPCRWIKPENLHITLEFLGHIADQDLIEVFQRAKELAEKNKPFEARLDKVCYGPPGKMPPRMIWVTGPKIAQLNVSPHITLARIRTWEWRKIEPEERPDIAENLDLSFEVTSFEVMESRLKKGGPEYTILESFELKSREL